jgi:small subunit ribosomal protein S20
MRALLSSTDKAEVAENMPKVVALLDKLAKRNVIHKNKAANLKSAIMKKAATV